MILGAHIIFSTYGFWLPNDPRGSWSEFVASWELLRFGKATKVETHRSVAKAPHNRQLRRDAKHALNYPPVRFTGIQALIVARGFARAISDGGYVIHACAILPHHVHLVVAAHNRPYEQIAAHLKSAATRALTEARQHPLSSYQDPDGSFPSPWAEGIWKVYADSDEDLIRIINYVERNPEKEGKRRQLWPFVVPYTR